MGGRGSSSNSGNVGGLTIAAVGATAGYTDTISSYFINSALRHGDDLTDYQAVIDRMDSNMELTKKTMVVRREVDINDMVDQILKISPPENTFDSLRETAIGKEFSDPGYMSSYHTYVGNMYGNTIMEITAKPGTKAILTRNNREAEVILGRNQRWKVTDVTKEGRKFVFHITNKGVN